MSLFKNLTSEGLEDTQDRIGGYSVFDTDVYSGKIKMAYAIQSKNGAHGIALIADLGGREYRETIYVTDRSGKNYYEIKDKNGKPVVDDNGRPKRNALPGFTTIDDLCQVTTDKTLSEQDTSEKLVNVYDADAGKEVPKAVPVLVDMLDKPILVAIQKSTVDKTERNDAGEYVPTGESREENNIEKVFHPALRCTVVEARTAISQDKTPVAEFIDIWADKNKGKVRDKRQNKDGGANSGRPGSKGPPQAAQASAAPKRSLFSNNGAAA